MSRLLAAIKSRVAAARRRSPLFDHVVAMVVHYNAVKGNLLAGAATYFAFLSFFPLLALAFFVVGYIKHRYPGSEDATKAAIEQVLPGIISNDPTPRAGQITFAEIQDAAAIAGVIGLVGVVYAGLGWVSGLRDALVAAMRVPGFRQRGFLAAKGIDLLLLPVLGLVLVLSVAVSSVAAGLTATTIDLLRLPSVLGHVLVIGLGLVIGVAASTLLFLAIYRLLPHSRIPTRALLQGAVLAAIGFEALKLIVVNVLGGVGGSAFAPLAFSITLLVWINYFSRLVMLGACFAYTSTLNAADRELRGLPPAAVETDPQATVRVEPLVVVTAGAGSGRSLALVGGLLVALWAWARHQEGTRT